MVVCESRGKSFLETVNPPPPTHTLFPPPLLVLQDSDPCVHADTHPHRRTYIFTYIMHHTHTYTPSGSVPARGDTERGGGPVWRWGWTEERRKLRKLDLSMTNHKAGKPRLLTKMIKLRITSSTSYAVPGMKRNPQTTQLSIAHKKYARHIHTRRLRTAVVTANGISGD